MGIRADQVATVNNEQMGDHAEWDAHGNFVYDVALKADDRIEELEAALRHATKIEEALRELVDAYKGNTGNGNAAERIDLAVRMAELILRTR